ncbi:hypothetical protein H7U19_12915 [Hyunsoonleella sp. SJ7]|uniref:Uncharacterized protein n=2 Tax=Hyunsoonleella aquatilis TaxID=2762758 RepID=A0A923HCE0_9FLAO|nr:hypothetical protein [Hyunsoonleella aquatilis]
MALVLLIMLATIIPVPITVYRKDKLPNFTIEQIDKKEDEDEEDDIKELF